MRVLSDAAVLLLASGFGGGMRVLPSSCFVFDATQRDARGSQSEAQQAWPGRLSTVACDVTDPASIRSMADEVGKAHYATCSFHNVHFDTCRIS